jgi:hypothetical protein
VYDKNFSFIVAQSELTRLKTDWGYSTFETKEETIEQAKAMFDDGCIIGKLEHVQGVNYGVVNQEKILFN